MATLNHSGVIAKSTLQKISRAETGNLLTALALGNKMPEHASEASLGIINKVQALQYSCDNEKLLFIAELILWVEDTTLPLPEVDDSLVALLDFHRLCIRQKAEEFLLFAKIRFLTDYAPFSFYRQIKSMLDVRFNYKPCRFSSLCLILALVVRGVENEIIDLITSNSVIDHFDDINTIIHHLHLCYTTNIHVHTEKYIGGTKHYSVKCFKINKTEKNGNIRFNNVTGCINFHLLIFDIFCQSFPGKFPPSLRNQLNTIILALFKSDINTGHHNFFRILNLYEEKISLIHEIEFFLNVFMHQNSNHLETYILEAPSRFYYLYGEIYNSVNDISCSAGYIHYFKYHSSFVELFSRYFPQELYDHLLSGNNIRTFGNYNTILSKKAAHVFSTLDISDLKIHLKKFSNFNDIIKYCIIKSFGLNDHLVFRLSQYLVLNLEHPETFKRAYAFWENIFNFLGRYHDQFIDLGEMQQNVLLSYFQHCHDDLPEFSLKGRNFNSVNRLAIEFQRNNTNHYQSIFFSISWAGANYNEIYFKNLNSTSYKIVQLLTTEALQAESNRMSHCVWTYASRCKLGICSIWSLREEYNDGWVPRVTIQVDRNRNIVQMKSRFNENPSDYHLEMIKNWAQTEKLTFPGLLTRIEIEW